MAEKPSEKTPEEPEGAGQSGEPIPDDVWARFVEDSERDIHTSDAPKEPSARARMVTERLRQQEARGELPPGWRTGPAWQEMNGRAARRRKVWTIIGVVLAIALAVVAMKPSLLPGDPFGTGTDEGTQSANPLPDETAAPTNAPSGAPGTPTLDEPFAGSPAVRYADGAAGIVLPEATPVGAFGKDQVAKALAQTKSLLVDANLDRKTLLGGTPETTLDKILDPKQPDMIDDARSWLREPGKDSDPLWLFSRFDPDEVRLVGDVVKTRGRTTFKAGKDGGVAIHADYTFVYALAPADPDATEVTRTIVRRILDLELLNPATYEVTPGRLSVDRHDQDLANSACDVYDGFLHPQFDSADPTGAPPSGPTTDPYDRSRDLGNSGTEECGTVSRT
ncbi:hypothetical protein QFZ24_004144 [Streptomyces phaeochromogenes]|jgi:hypothetical protein|uniref:hypothetical protein n=1 Tax=Streptomyces TaxID=1883 RepID=UPI00117F7023|nr:MULTISPECIES: hypothetical protein [Streptomyces]MDQ0950221.1 hypothetical protein [Streptomyces phaeochromogenes]TRO62709.1 hypothetical protein E4K73_22220 [Streptomyces sp. IB201691-2A2]